MTKKLKEKFTHNLKVYKKKRKIDYLKKSQNLRNLTTYQNPSKKYRQNLNQKHKDNIHMEKTIKCGICSKDFRINSLLKQHIGSVHEGKTIKCEFCSSRFSAKSSLKHPRF